MLKKAIIYARVSSKEQEKEGFSIPAQINLLKDYGAKHGITIVKEFTDAETAKTAGREQFSAMLKFLKRTDVKALLVEKTDRLYRNFRDYVTIDEIEDIEVHLVKENEILSKDSKSHQKFIHGIKVLMAKNYIDNLSEEVKKGLYEKASRGQYPGQAPIGYLNIINENKEHIMGIDAERGPLIEKLFELYATEKYTIDSLHSWALKQGLWSKYGKPIARGTIEHILKNPVYYGGFFYAGKLYRGTHDPIVSKDLWDRVQKAFKRTGKPATQDRHNFTFTGLMTCADCGCAVVAEIKKGKYVYYHCSRIKKQCRYRDAYVREEVLAEQFEGVIKSIQVPEDIIETIVSALKESFHDKNCFRDEAIAGLRQKIDTLQARIDQAYIDKLDGKIREEFWLDKTNQWHEEKMTLEAQLNAYNHADMPYYESGKKILELGKHAHQLYLRATNQEKRELLNLIKSNYYLKNGTLEYSLKKPFNWMAEWAARPAMLGDLDSNQD